MNNADVPFSALYLLEQNKLVLKSTSAIPKDHPAAPLEISLNGNPLLSHPHPFSLPFISIIVDNIRAWPAHHVMTSEASVVVEQLEEKLGHLPGGLWTESSQSAFISPIMGTDRKAVGMLVLGVNVRRALDDDYMYSPPIPLSSPLTCYSLLIRFLLKIINVLSFHLHFTSFLLLIDPKGLFGVNNGASSKSNMHKYSITRRKETCRDALAARPVKNHIFQQCES